MADPGLVAIVLLLVAIALGLFGWYAINYLYHPPGELQRKKARPRN